jgi:hypothetical protein
VEYHTCAGVHGPKKVLKWRERQPFAPFMWTYSRQSQFALLTFTDRLSLTEAYSAAVEIREGAGAAPVRVVIDVAEAELSETCVIAFMGVLEEVAVIDLVVLGASRAAQVAFQIAWSSFTVPVAFHDNGLAWLASERSRETGRRRASVRPRLVQAAPESGTRPVAHNTRYAHYNIRRAG